MSAGAAAGTRWAGVKQKVHRVLAGVGFVTLASAALAGAAARRRRRDANSLPDEFILELDLEQHSLVEHVRPKGIQSLLLQQGPAPLALSHVVEALQAAGNDERVKGLLALIGGQAGMGLAQVQELRDAVTEFRERSAGRAACVAYSDAFGEAGAGGTGAFYLATAFQHIFMQPTGTLSVTGLAATTPFARGLLDRWKVKPVFFAREEYKSAASFILNTTFSRPERQALQSSLKSLSGQVVRGIAAGRGLTESQVRSAIDTAPHLGSEAQAMSLIDGQLFRDQALKVVVRLHEAVSQAAAAELPAGADKAPAGVASAAAAMSEPGASALQLLLREPDAGPSQDLQRVSIARYAAAVEQQRRQRETQQRLERSLARLLRQPWALVDAVRGLGGREEEQRDAAKQQQQQQEGSELPTVALLTLSGPIYLGTGPSSPIPSGPAAARTPNDKIASLHVIKSLRAARRDPAVRAVVLRIDSPGGSAAASDAIHREVALLRQVKPVIVSMANAAASGGYYIACAANKIVAQPGTITGSIGVLAGKLVIDDALREYGINAETVKEGRNADAMSPFTGFDRQQRKKVDHMVDATYEQFKKRVADGRGLSKSDVAQLAKGRVWTGEQALDLGLVDRLGGLQAAIEMAKQEAGLPAQDGAVAVRQVYPEDRTPLQQALKMLRGGGEGEDGGSSNGGGGAAPAAGPLAGMAAALGLQLSAAEWALLLQQQGSGGGAIGCQCLALDAERLASAVAA